MQPPSISKTILFSWTETLWLLSSNFLLFFPFPHLPSCTPLPAFQLFFKALTDQFCLQLGRRDPQPPPPVSAFLLLHKPGHWGLLSLRMSGAHPKVKFPFSSRQLRQIGLEGRPPPELLRALSTQLSPAQFPRDLLPVSTFLLLAPQVPQPHLTPPSLSSV